MLRQAGRCRTMPEENRNRGPLFNDNHLRIAFTVVTTGMILGLVVLYFLITARPSGQFTQADTWQYVQNMTRTTEQLSGFREREDGRVQLDINHAIQLVAERGVQNPFTTAEATEVPAGEAEEAAPTDVETAELPSGSAVYAPCSGCHQANGQGVPGAFPPLAGHAVELFEADPGYLANTVSFGLQGPIEVDGMTYNGLMPGWQSLSDAEIAAVLNYILTDWGNDVGEEPPYDAEFIAEQRQLDLTPSDVHEQRQELDL